jgi:hypothetical protein
LASQYLARTHEISRRIDTVRHGIDNGDVDAHACFKGAQLLEPFALLQR